ncbi:MAG: hypothetical protein HY343_01595 [Lentisphaerae bacterium]|nr:hypothetical protein [Lentisphaerota bacterium]
MTPAERLYTAVSGGVPDRVPVVPKIFVDSAAHITGTSLIDVIQDPLTALRVILEAGLAVGVDGIRQFHVPPRRVVREQGMVLEVDESGRKLGEVDMLGGLTTKLFNGDDFHLEDPCQMAFLQYWTSDEPFIHDLADVQRMAIPSKSFYEEIGCGDRQRAIVKMAGDRIALIGDCISATLCFCAFLRRTPNALTDLLDRPRLVHALMEKGVAYATERGKFSVDLGFNILRLNDSIGNMSVISPRHWREFVFPHIKAVCDELHRYHPGVRIYSHICGNILPIIDDLIKTGLDCIGPLDPLGGFTCAQVREIAGNRVALMGGVNTLSFVENTPEEIIEESRRCIAGAGVRGGYVLGSGCMVPPGSRRETLAALMTAVKRFGVYRNGVLIPADPQAADEGL